MSCLVSMIHKIYNQTYLVYFFTTFIMKRFVLFIISVFAQILLVAQTQFDYMDDDAVAGGADRALNGIIIIACNT